MKKIKETKFKIYFDLYSRDFDEVIYKFSTALENFDIDLYINSGDDYLEIVLRNEK